MFGIFEAVEGFCAIIQLAAEGLAGICHLSAPHEPKKGERVAGFTALFTLIGVLGLVGFLVYDAYNPTKNTQILCDNIARNMADKDPFKDDEDEGPYLLEKDGWDNPIRYFRAIDEGDADVVLHEIRSSGADGILNTSDDLVAESKSQNLAKSIGKTVGSGAKEFVKGVWNGIWD
jgi:hypothetical protein